MGLFMSVLSKYYTMAVYAVIQMHLSRDNIMLQNVLLISCHKNISVTPCYS